MDSKVAPELDYKKTEVSVPKYQLSILTQQNNSNTVTLSNSGGQQSIFELPASNAFNFSPSVLSYQYTLPDLNGAYNNAFIGLPLIQQLSVYTRSGVYLCDIPNFNYYSKICLFSDTKIQDFLTFDQQNMITRNNGLTTSAQGSRPSAGYTVGAGPAYTNVCQPSSLNYTEPYYAFQGVVGTGAGPGNVTINVNMPLGQIKNTLLALDKDVYFGETVLLRITWAAYTTAGFTTTAVFPALTGVLALATAFQVTNLNLYLAVEQNMDITNSLKEQIAREGISMLVDYCYPQVYNYPARISQQSLSYKFNRGHGRKLKRIYHTFFNGNGAPNTQFDNTNVIYYAPNAVVGALNGIYPGANILNYYTNLDNVRLQQFSIDCSAYQDWMIQQDKLKDSVYQNANMYQYNWVHIESWDGLKTTEHDCNSESGIDLSYERKWDWLATGNSAAVYGNQYPINYYTFAITSKIMSVVPSGISII